MSAKKFDFCCAAKTTVRPAVIKKIYQHILTSQLQEFNNAVVKDHLNLLFL